MEISSQTPPDQSPVKDDPLDQHALEIARRNKLEGESLQKLSSVFSAGATTLHRKLKGWLEEGRFELTDTWSGQTTALQAAIDEPLGERLARETAIRRARVAQRLGQTRIQLERDFVRGAGLVLPASAFQEATAHVMVHRQGGHGRAGWLVGSLQCARGVARER